MQHLSDYSAAYDSEGERESAIADAIEREAVRIAFDKAALTEVIAGWLIDSDTDIAELLAMLYARGHKAPPIWAIEGLSYAERQLAANINAEIDKQAALNVQERIDEQQRQRREGSGG